MAIRLMDLIATAQTLYSAAGHTGREALGLQIRRHAKQGNGMLDSSVLTLRTVENILWAMQPGSGLGAYEASTPEPDEAILRAQACRIV